MIVAVFADMHGHAEALDAVLEASAGADERWSLGDMVGTGPDPDYVVAKTREHCRVALLGNHDYQLLRLIDQREREPQGERSQRREPAGRVVAALGDTPANPSIELARERLDEDALTWMRARKPAARRQISLRDLGAREREPPGERSERREPAGRVVAVQLWHGGPHNAVHEFVGPRNAPSCLAKQQAALGLVGHTHVAAAFHDGTRKVRITPGVPLDIGAGKWLLNPGPVIDAASWLELDLEARTATWRLAPFDPAPARERARALGLESRA